MIKVAKFGGSSTADDKAFKKVAEWLLKDNDIKIAVLSAAGKTEKFPKVTDILLVAWDEIQNGKSVLKSLIPFFERVRTDAERLKLYDKIKDELMKIGEDVLKDFSSDFLLSRGEYIYAKLFSYYSGIRFVDSKNLIVFDDGGRVNYGYSDYKIKEEYEKGGRFVTGGFYGAYRNGKIKTFSRGGSDFSGAIVARALLADEYINFTDVDGVYSFNPQLSQRAEIIKEIGFNEIRRLGEFGASVLHTASILPLRGSGVNIRLRNTFNKDSEGTVIYENCKTVPFAMAMRDDCRYAKIKKTENGYNLINGFVKSGIKIMALNANSDDIEICFCARNEPEEIIRDITPEVYLEDSEIKFFYMTPCKKAEDIIGSVVNESDVLYSVYGKGGGYIVVKEKGYKRVIERL